MRAADTTARFKEIAFPKEIDWDDEEHSGRGITAVAPVSSRFGEKDTLAFDKARCEGKDASMLLSWLAVLVLFIPHTLQSWSKSAIS